MAAFLPAYPHSYDGTKLPVLIETYYVRIYNPAGWNVRVNFRKNCGRVTYSRLQRGRRKSGAGCRRSSPTPCCPKPSLIAAGDGCRLTFILRWHNNTRKVIRGNLRLHFCTSPILEKFGQLGTSWTSAVSNFNSFLIRGGLYPLVTVTGLKTVAHVATKRMPQLNRIVI